MPVDLVKYLSFPRVLFKNISVIKKKISSYCLSSVLGGLFISISYCDVTPSLSSPSAEAKLSHAKVMDIFFYRNVDKINIGVM